MRLFQNMKRGDPKMLLEGALASYGYQQGKWFDMRFRPTGPKADEQHSYSLEMTTPEAWAILKRMIEALAVMGSRNDNRRTSIEERWGQELKDWERDLDAILQSIDDWRAKYDERKLS